MFDFSVPKPGRSDADAPALRNAPFYVYSILAVIRLQWWRSMITAALFVLGAAVVIPIVPERFTAKAQIFIEPVDLRVVDKSVIDSNQLNDTANSQVESQSRILVSTTVLAHVVDQQNLTADTEFNGKQPSLLSSVVRPIMTAVASQQTSRETDDVSIATVDNLQRHVKVERLPQSFIVELSVSTDNASKSAHLANAITQAYLDEEASSQAATVRRASESLSARLDSLRESARAAEEKVQRFKEQHQLVVAAGQPVVEAQTAELNNQLVLARTRAAAAKVRFDQTKKMLTPGFDAGELPESIMSPTISRLRDQYADASRREAVLAATLGPQHPALIQARSDLARARALLNDEIVRTARSSKDDYERAVADEASLENSLQMSKDEVLKAGDADVVLHELERDAEEKRNIYEALAVRSREIGEQAGIDTNNIRIISAATAPMNRNFPPPTSLILSAAFILGFGASSGRAVLRTRLSSQMGKS
ncbi:MAG: GumC family protein [Xanthobacteraceae bacterium]